MVHTQRSKNDILRDVVKLLHSGANEIKLASGARTWLVYCLFFEADFNKPFELFDRY